VLLAVGIVKEEKRYAAALGLEPQLEVGGTGQDSRLRHASEVADCVLALQIMLGVLVELGKK